MKHFLFIVCVLSSLTGRGQQDSVFKYESDSLIIFENETFPEFPGGEAALLLYLSDHIEFPTDHTYSYLRLVFKLDITETGTIENVILIRPEDYSDSFTDHVADVLSEMPNWTPATQNGKPVPLSFYIPITTDPK